MRNTCEVHYTVSQKLRTKIMIIAKNKCLFLWLLHFTLNDINTCFRKRFSNLYIIFNWKNQLKLF